MERTQLSIAAKVFIIPWVIFLLKFKGVSGEMCEKIGDCSCRKSNGKVISLKEVDGGKRGPAFKNISSDTNSSTLLNFDWNPCTAFDDGDGCNNVLMCENLINQTRRTCAKNITSFEVNEDGSTTIVYRPYKTGNKTRKLQITLKCDESQYPGTPGAVKVSKSGFSENYTMTFTSKCACDDGCVSHPHVDPTEDPAVKHKPKGLSKGSVLLIVFFAIVCVYLLGGILVKKYKMGAESIQEMIPNYEFWAGIPSLIEDGIVFTCTGLQYGCVCISRKCSKRTYYAEI